MVFHGSWLFFHSSWSVFMVPGSLTLLFMVPGRFSWFQVIFHSFFMVPGWFFMVPGWFSWFVMVPGWFFMVIHGSRLVFHGFSLNVIAPTVSWPDDPI